MIMISSALKDYQAVIAVDSGHINVHETGAVEFTGHKILTKPHQDGKAVINGIRISKKTSTAVNIGVIIDSFLYLPIHFANVFIIFLSFSLRLNSPYKSTVSMT